MYSEPPPAAWTAPLIPGTTIPEVRFVVVPSPSWPDTLWPHVMTRPSVSVTTPASRAEPIVTAFATLSTVTGRVRCVVVPSPRFAR